MTLTDGEKIVLGSGKLYVDVYAGTIPTDLLLEVEDNLIGLISGGAELIYKPTFYNAKDDLGLVSKDALIAEDVSLKAGTMTWCGKTLAKLTPTGRVTELTGIRTVKIGGLSQQDGLQYVIHFVYTDPVTGKIGITIVGGNQSGFAFKFAKDKETVIDMEFKAVPIDGEGTLIIFTEQIPGV